MEKGVTVVKDLGNPFAEEGSELYSLDTNMALPEADVKSLLSANDIVNQPYENLCKAALLIVIMIFMIRFQRII